MTTCSDTLSFSPTLPFNPTSPKPCRSPGASAGDYLRGHHLCPFGKGSRPRCRVPAARPGAHPRWSPGVQPQPGASTDPGHVPAGDRLRAIVASAGDEGDLDRLPRALCRQMQLAPPVSATAIYPRVVAPFFTLKACWWARKLLPSIITSEASSASSCRACSCRVSRSTLHPDAGFLPAAKAAVLGP